MMPMPPLSRISETTAGPLPTISTMTVPGLRQHLPLYAPSTLDSGISVSSRGFTNYSKLSQTEFQKSIADSAMAVSGPPETRGTVDELGSAELMNRHVRGGVPLKVWHKWSATVSDGDQYVDIPTLSTAQLKSTQHQHSVTTEAVAPSIISKEYTTIVQNSHRSDSMRNCSLASRFDSRTSIANNFRYGGNDTVNSNNEVFDGRKVYLDNALSGKGVRDGSFW